MLYDPKWGKTETKADPSTLENLIAWLAKQPKDKSYDWLHPAHCLLGQWCRSEGVIDVVGQSLMLADKDLPYFGIALVPPFNFGAALKRARVAFASLTSSDREAT